MVKVVVVIVVVTKNMQLLFFFVANGRSTRESSSPRNYALLSGTFYVRGNRARRMCLVFKKAVESFPTIVPPCISGNFFISDITVHFVCSLKLTDHKDSRGFWERKGKLNKSGSGLPPWPNRDGSDQQPISWQSLRFHGPRQSCHRCHFSTSEGDKAAQTYTTNRCRYCQTLAQQGERGRGG